MVCGHKENEYTAETSAFLRPLFLNGWLVLLLTFAHTAIVFAQAESLSAALSPDRKRFSEVLLSVAINGQDLHEVALFLRRADGHILVAEDDIHR
jgi:hypothetical protein